MHSDFTGLSGTEFRLASQATAVTVPARVVLVDTRSPLGTSVSALRTRRQVTFQACESFLRALFQSAREMHSRYSSTRLPTHSLCEMVVDVHD
jgi:hypothetical protein